MASNKVVTAVQDLCAKALKTGHPLHGVVQTPAKWATDAGFQGSAASPLRQFMARNSSNGCGRNGRYGPQDAQGMLDLLTHADKFVKADTAAKQTVERKAIRTRLDKNRKAAKSGAKAAKTATKATPKKVTA